MISESQIEKMSREADYCCKCGSVRVVETYSKDIHGSEIYGYCAKCLKKRRLEVLKKVTKEIEARNQKRLENGEFD
jgi:hypothetical protein